MIKFISIRDMNIMIAYDMCASMRTYITADGVKVVQFDNIEYRISALGTIRLVDNKSTHYSKAV